jgi:hypothetical protein
LHATGASPSPGDAAPWHTNPIDAPAHATVGAGAHDAERSAPTQQNEPFCGALHARRASTSAGPTTPVHENPKPGSPQLVVAESGVHELHCCPNGKQQKSVAERLATPALQTKFVSPSSGRSLVHE